MTKDKWDAFAMDKAISVGFFVYTTLYFPKCPKAHARYNRIALPRKSAVY